MNEYINSHRLKEELLNAEQRFFFCEEDSKVPYISLNDNLENNKHQKYICIMFKKNGIKYFLNEKYGYTAYKNRMSRTNKISTYTWQLSKIEFLRVKKWMLESLDNCSNEYKQLCINAINELDYEQGRRNAFFQLISDSDGKTKIDRIRFNFKNLYYDLMMKDGSMFRGIIDDPWSHLNKKEVKGLEKKLVLSIINSSKTIKAKKMRNL